MLPIPALADTAGANGMFAPAAIATPAYSVASSVRLAAETKNQSLQFVAVLCWALNELSVVEQ